MQVFQDCLFQVLFQSTNHLPEYFMLRSHQSLNMFKSRLVKHGLKLFSLSKLLLDAFLLQIEHKLHKILSCSFSLIVVIFLNLV